MSRLRLCAGASLCLFLCAFPTVVRSARPGHDRAEISRILDRVVTLASNPEPWKSDHAALGQVAVLQAKMGDLASARKSAAAIPDQIKMVKVAVLSAIAEAEMRAGSKTEAEQTFTLARVVAESRVSGSNNPEWIAEFFRPIAEARLRLHDVEGAVQLLKTREAGFSLDMAVYQIVASVLDAGDMDGARKFAAAMPVDARMMAACTEAIASRQADLDDLDGARKTRARLRHDGSGSGVIHEIAARRARTEPVEQLVAWAESRKSREERIQALMGIAEGLFGKLNPGVPAARP